MRDPVLLDTNVGVVANGKTSQATSECIETSIRELIRTREKKIVLLDEGGLILEEYRRHMSPSGQPGPGDAFFKWLWNNQSNKKVCCKVKITPTGDGGSFAEFPPDRELDGFDHSDRKFVAVAIASGKRPTILNSSDTDWWEYRHPLTRHGIIISFLCPELMERKH
jgi:hypothetical protein